MQCVVLQLTQVHDFSRVVPEVHLCADEQEGRLTPVLLDLRHPFLPHVVIRVRVDDAEADQEDVSVGVGNQTQPAMVFLDIFGKTQTCRSPLDQRCQRVG